MHIIQSKILELSKKFDLRDLTLRDIANKIGFSGSSPQKIKHHIEQLTKKGFDIYKNKKLSNLISIPIIGTADCGSATIFAEPNFQGFVEVSKNLLTNTKNYKNLFAVSANGLSMNKAEIGGKKIEDGDFVIVDKEQVIPKNRDIILAIIDNNATIKRFIDDRIENNQIILMPDSTKNFNPIYLHEDDNFSINGKVVDVVKKPKK